eukprot:SAG31_NODE_32023_length_361_cov_0.660305_1_plen_87_part_01
MLKLRRWKFYLQSLHLRKGVDIPLPEDAANSAVLEAAERNVEAATVRVGENLTTLQLACHLYSLQTHIDRSAKPTADAQSFRRPRLI